MKMEGGTMGHMAHPYDILSPQEFIKFIDDVLAGEYELWEKVDGVALTVGLDKNGNTSYVRSKKAQPSPNIEEKFPLEHPGSDAFRSGFQAVRKAFKKLSEQQITQFHLDKYFINIEIIYGFVPNLIPYSETGNYIVFHHYVDPEKEYEAVGVEGDILNDLAKEIGQIAVVSKVVTYVGTPQDADRIVESRTSSWEFRGPIRFDKSEVTDRLSRVLDSWRKMPETKKITQEKDKEKRFELMQRLAQKVGSSILTTMVSKLSRTEKEFPGHPRIEGLVVKYKDGLNKETLVKITGDFRELNQALWGPLRDELDPLMKDFNTFMMAKVFGIPKVSKFTSKTMNKYETTDELLQARSKVNPASTDIHMDAVNAKIDNTLSKLQTMWAQEYDPMKNEDIKRALLISGYKLKKLKHNINKASNISGAFKAYLLNMFGFHK